MEDLQGYLDALDYAIRRHGDQLRKDGRRLFVTHPVAVAEELRAAGVTDQAALEAALLHDVLEDTSVKYDELADRFGDDVAALVVELSDDVRLPRAKRRAAALAKAATLSPTARAVKLADLAANLADLHRAPPSGWDAARLASFRAHCAELLEVLRSHGDPPPALVDRVAALLA